MPQRTLRVYSERLADAGMFVLEGVIGDLVIGSFRRRKQRSRDLENRVAIDLDWMLDDPNDKEGRKILRLHLPKLPPKVEPEALNEIHRTFPGVEFAHRTVRLTVDDTSDANMYQLAVMLCHAFDWSLQYVRDRGEFIRTT